MSDVERVRAERQRLERERKAREARDQRRLTRVDGWDPDRERRKLLWLGLLIVVVLLLAAIAGALIELVEAGMNGS